MKILLFVLVLVILLVTICKAEDIFVPDFKDTSNDILDVEISQEIKSEFPYYLSGFDFEGVPIWVAEMGKWDTRKAAEGPAEKLRDFKIHLIQLFKRCTGGNNNTNEYVGLFDMEGFTLRQVSSTTALKTMFWVSRQAEQALSGSGLKAAYLVNANYVFKNLFETLKPILGRETAKVEVYGTNRNIWIPKLLKDIPKDQIPSWYGGSANHKPVEFYG